MTEASIRIAGPEVVRIDGAAAIAAAVLPVVAVVVDRAVVTVVVAATVGPIGIVGSGGDARGQQACDEQCLDQLHGR